MPFFIPPIVWGVGAAVTAAAAAGWFGRGATEDLLTAYGPTPDLVPGFIVSPVAPVTETEMRVSGAFTPQEMQVRTAESQRIVNQAVNRVRRVEGSQDALRLNYGGLAVDDAMNPLWIAGAAAAGLALVLLATRG